MDEQIKTTPNPLMPTAVDVLMYVGKNNYSVQDAVLEYEAHGISKRISVGSIPEGMVPGVSRIFLAHMEAILKVTAEGKGLRDLIARLYEEGAITNVEQQKLLNSEDLDRDYWEDVEKKMIPEAFVPEGMLDLIMALDACENRAKIVKEFGIQFHPGVFGFGYLQSVQYILKQGEDDLPDSLKHYRGYITPTRLGPSEGAEEGD